MKDRDQMKEQRCSKQKILNAKETIEGTVINTLREP